MSDRGCWNTLTSVNYNVLYELYVLYDNHDVVCKANEAIAYFYQ